MTYSEALEYLLNIPRFSQTASLERIRLLLSALGNPQNSLKFVHIAGTNGKGSITTMLSRILSSAGYKTGTFISPFVDDFRERICIDGEFINKNALAKLTDEVSEICNQMKETPNAFEQITAIALKYFCMNNCDLVCLEAGLGGRFDATNVISPPLLSIIASIGLDHMHILGQTHEEIALEKCGIIKETSKTVISPFQPDGIKELIADDCKKKDVPFFIPDCKKLRIINMSLNGSDLTYKGKDYHISLQGEHQIYNALTVIEATKVLRSLGYALDHETVFNSLRSVTFPARMEILSNKPVCILDGAHNIPGITVLFDSLKKLTKKKIVTVFGVLEEKSTEAMAEIVSKNSDAVFCVSPASEKALNPEKLQEFCSTHCNNTSFSTELYTAIKDALDYARNNNCILIICGSLYLASSARKELKKALKT